MWNYQLEHFLRCINSVSGVNTEKGDFDQRTACKAPTRWSKYITNVKLPARTVSSMRLILFLVKMSLTSLVMLTKLPFWISVIRLLVRFTLRSFGWVSNANGVNFSVEKINVSWNMFSQRPTDECNWDTRRGIGQGMLKAPPLKSLGLHISVFQDKSERGVLHLFEKALKNVELIFGTYFLPPMLQISDFGISDQYCHYRSANYIIIPRKCRSKD